MGSAAARSACKEPPKSDAAASECPEIFADAFGRAVSARLAAQGIQSTGIGAGVCGNTRGGYDDWHFSISISDWKDADAAVAAVDAELRRWGAGHFFDVTVRGVSCPTFR